MLVHCKDAVLGPSIQDGYYVTGHKDVRHNCNKRGAHGDEVAAVEPEIHVLEPVLHAAHSATYNLAKQDVLFIGHCQGQICGVVDGCAKERLDAALIW